MKRTLLKSNNSIEIPVVDDEEWGLTQYIRETNCASPKSRMIDILMVVKDQFPYVKHCIESIRKNTPRYHLHVWDNGSEEITAGYLRMLAEQASWPQQMTLYRKEENTGFIIPNNRLIEMGDLEYVVLLNSDCYMREGWDRALTGWLEHSPHTAQVGYMGGYLDHSGRGVRGGQGDSVDYICGCCFCIRRSTYEEIGLFDEDHLEFAYCEDADLSMRLREAGKKIYALHLPLVEHYGNKTAIPVIKENHQISGIIAKNHTYLQQRWKKFLP